MAGALRGRMCGSQNSGYPGQQPLAHFCAGGGSKIVISVECHVLSETPTSNG